MLSFYDVHFSLFRICGNSGWYFLHHSTLILPFALVSLYYVRHHVSTQSSPLNKISLLFILKVLGTFDSLMAAGLVKGITLFRGFLSTLRQEKEIQRHRC